LLTGYKVTGALVASNVVRVQWKRPAVGEPPQVAAVNATLVFVAGDGFKKRALSVQATVAALHTFTVDGDWHVLEAKKDIVEVVLHGPSAQGFEMDPKLRQIVPVLHNKPTI
jgi:hypothetical protein